MTDKLTASVLERIHEASACKEGSSRMSVVAHDCLVVVPRAFNLS